MVEYILHNSHATEQAAKHSRKMYVSTPYNRVQAVEEKLKKIFNDEINSDGSILLSYKPEVISKLARFLSGHVTRSATEFEIKNAITRVNTDDYYYDRSDMVKAAGSFAEFAKHYDLDVPHALELELMSKHIKELLSGKSVYLPKYDMSGTAKIGESFQNRYFGRIIYIDRQNQRCF